MEHKRNLINLKNWQPLADHALEAHSNLKMTRKDFRMEITGIFDKLLPRLIAEGHQLDSLISKREEFPGTVTVLNSKENYHQAKNIKLVAIKQDY